MPDYKVFKPFDDVKQAGGKIIKPIYQPNIFDWIILNGRLIRGFASVANSTTTVYTVPASNVFYLVSVSLMGINDAVTTIPTLDFEVDGTPALTVITGKADGAAGNTASTFSIPIKLVAGQTLAVRSNRANVWIRACFMGYEMHESLKPF